MTVEASEQRELSLKMVPTLHAPQLDGWPDHALLKIASLKITLT